MHTSCVVLCNVCGNEVLQQAAQCPFCGAGRTPSQPAKNTSDYRVVNLEKGMPLVQAALQRMHSELETARLHHERVVLLIHGYGSSGRGGAIKKEVCRQLQYLLDKKNISDFLPGEDCDKRAGRFRQVKRRFPFIEELINKPNPGITLVML